MPTQFRLKGVRVGRGPFCPRDSEAQASRGACHAADRAPSSRYRTMNRSYFTLFVETVAIFPTACTLFNQSQVFDDGLAKKIDLKPFINEGISADLRDINFFNQVYLDNGSVTWPNGYDFCSVFLREDI